MKYTIYRSEMGFTLWETSEHWERVDTPIVRMDNKEFGFAVLKDLEKRMDEEKEKEYYAKYMH